ncbi:MAG: hypothetical protein K0U66_04220 [Gammaproteobacteria bacterium]|nr:hypothetical protein [Gammaproteobacteria bacterium]
MAKLILSEGTTLEVSKAELTGTGTNGARTAADYGTLTGLEDVGDITDLPSPEPTRTTNRIPTLRGERIGQGTTTRATFPFTILTEETRRAGYDLLREAFGQVDKTTGVPSVPFPLTCKVTATDGSVKFFEAHVEGAQEATPIGGNLQMLVTLAVEGNVTSVAAADVVTG